MDKKTKTYTAIDFARYHDGNMEAKEMHSLEKAALEDPFLADALEGYIHTSSATEDVQHLRSLLAEKTTQKKVYSIASVSQNVWWRIAAIFILIGIAGYFIFNMGMDEGRTSAKNETVHLKQRVEQLPAFDSPATAMVMENEKRNMLAPATSGIESAPVNPEQSQIKVFPEKKETNLKRPDNFDKNSPASRQQSFSLQRKLEDTTLITGDYARVATNDLPSSREEIRVTSKLKTGDSNNIARSALLSTDTPMMALQSTADQARSMNKKNAELSELNVLEEAQKRNANQKTGVNLHGKVAGVEITFQSNLQPIEGAENYKIYISKNKQELLDSNNNALHGSVQLEFSINKQGQPIQINVIKSQCLPCENQAINLLKNGPLWKGDLNKKGELTIVF
jgi:hypothetical protein